MNRGNAPKAIALRVALTVTGLALVAMVATLANRDHASATSFNPTLTLTLSNTALSANADITSEFNISEPDSNFGGLVAFTSSAFGVARSADLPSGAIVGRLDSVATLGLLNTTCSLKIPVGFDLLNGSINTGDTIPPLAPGLADPLSPLALDTNPANGIPDGVDKYPLYLNTLFPGLTPRARAIGINNRDVPGTTVVLNFLLFEPATVFPATSLGPGLPAPDVSLGYPSVTVLQDPTVPPSPSPITDFCAPLKSTTVLFGLTKDNTATGANEAGAVVRTNPAADGVYNFVTFARSIRDADDDGMENSLDTCPYSADPGFDPRKAVEAGGVPNPTTDPDKDGIPNSCDPTPNVNTQNNDHDFDRFLNNGDNCPLVTNNDAKDGDFDGIGDACDTSPDPDGHRHELCVSVAVTIGAGGSAPAVICPGGAPIVTVTAGAQGTGTGGTGGTSGTGATSGTGGAGAAAGAARGPGGGPSTGVGSLAPVASAIPAWAAIATGLGSAGLLSGLASLFRGVRRRRP